MTVDQNAELIRHQILSKWEDHFIVYPDEDVQTLIVEMERVPPPRQSNYGETFLQEMSAWVNDVMRAAATDVSAPLTLLIVPLSEWKLKAKKPARGRTPNKGTGDPFITSGTLLKKGGGSSIFSRRNWTSRYFILDRDKGELRYYDDANKKNERGAIQLMKDTTVDIAAANLKGKHGRSAKASNQEPFYFVLNPVKDLHTRALRPSPFAIRAASQSEFDGWIKSFKDAIRAQQ